MENILLEWTSSATIMSLYRKITYKLSFSHAWRLFKRNSFRQSSFTANIGRVSSMLTSSSDSSLKFFHLVLLFNQFLLVCASGRCLLSTQVRFLSYATVSSDLIRCCLDVRQFLNKSWTAGYRGYVPVRARPTPPPPPPLCLGQRLAFRINDIKISKVVSTMKRERSG